MEWRQVGNCVSRCVPWSARMVVRFGNSSKRGGRGTDLRVRRCAARSLALIDQVRLPVDLGIRIAMRRRDAPVEPRSARTSRCSGLALSRRVRADQPARALRADRRSDREPRADRDRGVAVLGHAARPDEFGGAGLNLGVAAWRRPTWPGPSRLCLSAPTPAPPSRSRTYGLVGHEQSNADQCQGHRETSHDPSAVNPRG